MPSDSLMPITRHVDDCSDGLSSIHMLLALGAALNADWRVIALPTTVEISRCSTVPSGKITLSSEPPSMLKSVSAESSTVITVVVAALMRPARRDPALTGSEIRMICPGRTCWPASRLDAKVHTSFS